MGSPEETSVGLVRGVSPASRNRTTVQKTPKAFISMFWASAAIAPSAEATTPDPPVKT